MEKNRADGVSTGKTPILYMAASAWVHVRGIQLQIDEAKSTEATPRRCTERGALLIQHALILNALSVQIALIPTWGIWSRVPTRSEFSSSDFFRLRPI